MKISELSTEKAADMLCALVPCISDIAADEELLDELRRKVSIPAGASTAEVMMLGAEKLNKLVPILLREKRNAIFGILAILNEKSISAVAAQSLILTMKQVRDIVKDKELMDFFRSCTDAETSE